MLENKKMGRIVGVNGNLLTVEFDSSVTQNEVAYAIVGDSRLKCEVIRVRGSRADLQIFESSAGLKVGDDVEFTDALLSVKLGPGLLTQVYDGLQNPLEKLAEAAGFFLKRGLYMDPLDYESTWKFTPTAKVGDKVVASDRIGWVPEGIFQHSIMIPFAFKDTWEITEIAPAGTYKLTDTMAKVKNSKGEERVITMV